MVLLVVEAVNWKGIEMKPFGFNVEETVEFLRHAALGKPFLPYLVPLFFSCLGFRQMGFFFLELDSTSYCRLGDFTVWEFSTSTISRGAKQKMEANCIGHLAQYTTGAL